MRKQRHLKPSIIEDIMINIVKTAPLRQQLWKYV